MQFDISSVPIYMVYALGGVLVFMSLWIMQLERKIKRFTSGKNGKSLEDSIITIKASLDDLEKFRKNMEEYLIDVEKRLRRSTQGIETVRFNPFKGDGSGGNQSFATAFLDENGNGLVMSSLYARERISIFSKPIKKYTSEFELSDEEKKAIELAREKVVPREAKRREVRP